MGCIFDLCGTFPSVRNETSVPIAAGLIEQHFPIGNSRCLLTAEPSAGHALPLPRPWVPRRPFLFCRLLITSILTKLYEFGCIRAVQHCSGEKEKVLASSSFRALPSTSTTIGSPCVYRLTTETSSTRDLSRREATTAGNTRLKNISKGLF